ncbi:POTRA domain-containing protein [Segetibacter koreensis]|uniref:POTRA domain-containing protein n=1 Tax=Segetibacter koreensis TaxID=398037 RepID=UPI0004778B3D|nr:POTRA domain-containing protein [Segetibacter koreensis]
MAKLTRYILIAALSMLMSCTFFSRVYCQNNYRLIIHCIDKDSLFVAHNLVLKSSFSSALDCSDYVNKLPFVLQQKGYISSSIDSSIEVENQTVIYLFLGEKYDLLNLHIHEQDKNYLQQAGGELKIGKKEKFNFEDYRKTTDRLLDYFEANGFPFAKISLDSVSITGSEIDATLNIDRGFPYRIDSIRLYGPAKISRNFIHHYLNIERGSPYNKKKLEKINQRLLELPYLEQVQPWDVTMLNTGSLVNLYLAPKKSNQVNVLAGFLPSNQQLGGKLLLTVDANLQLQNAFGGGEHMGLMWQQIQPKSPRLNLQFTQPYMFNSSFGIDFLFDLYKKDSSFLNINSQLGLLYMLSPNKAGKVFLQTQRTNALQVDTLNIKASRRLPDVGDVSSVNFGVDYDVANTDYRFNPRKGNELNISALAGNKTIRKNTAITQIKDSFFDYSTLYDSIKLKAYQLRVRAKAAHYFKMGKQTIVKTGINAGWYESPSYFRNELFQIGGYRLLRGFDEESIYANKYVVGTVEYRYLVGLNSNFFIFSDAGWTSNPIIKQSNTYLGAGVGLSFETKGGIFNVSYAVGKRNDLSFDIKQSKIHIGYVSIF